MLLHLAILRVMFKLILWAALIACCWWWVNHIMLDYREGPPTWEPTTPESRRVVQRDGSVVLLPPVSVTAPTTTMP